MKRSSLYLSAVLAAAAAWAPKARAEFVFVATLTGDQVVPPSGSPGTAFGTFVLNDAMTMLSFDVTFTNLTSAATVMHFHDAPVGLTGPIVGAASLPSMTSGEVTGSVSLTPAAVAELERGNIYIDIHTVNFPRDPAAELRGQLTAVPEPSSLTLIGLGTLGLLGYSWRRKKPAA